MALRGDGVAGEGRMENGLTVDERSSGSEEDDEGGSALNHTFLVNPFITKLAQ